MVEGNSELSRWERRDIALRSLFSVAAFSSCSFRSSFSSAIVAEFFLSSASLASRSSTGCFFLVRYFRVLIRSISSGKG